jgi:hypothetical protein
MARMNKAVTHPSLHLKREYNLDSFTRWKYVLPIPQLLFNFIMTVDDADIGQMIKSLIVFMMTNGEVQPDVKLSTPEHKHIYTILKEHTRRYMFSSKLHLNSTIVEEKNIFRELFIETDLDAVADALADWDEETTDYDYFTEEELMEVDRLPEVTLLKDTVKTEEKKKKEGKRTPRPSVFSARRDVIAGTLMPTVDDSL